MGLDITCYANLRAVETPTLDEYGHLADPNARFWRPGPSMEWSESVWPGRAAELDPDQWYSYTDSIGFRAGSYGGYNYYRAGLTVLAGFVDRAEYLSQGSCVMEAVWPDIKVADSGAFLEQINFADNEGVIGAETARKLYNDYQLHLSNARTLFDGGVWFDRYNKWMEGFALAMSDGAVEFH